MQISVNKIDDIVKNTLDRFVIPACSVAIVNQDEIIFKSGYGTRTMGEMEPVDEHTVYALASISKSTAAACLGILVDEGRIKWNDPVRKYLPDFELYDSFVTQEIQVRDLLIHNSGLPSECGGTIWYGSSFSRKEVIERLRYLKPLRSFRSGYAYQNVTFLVAGELIAAVTGLSWDSFVQERIFNPLNMLRTKTKLSDLNLMENIATPHAIVNGQISPIPFRNHDNIGPAAAVNSSVWDWAQYLRMHLNSGRYEGKKILSPERIKEFWESNTPIAIEPLPDYFKIDLPFLNAYGLGWFLKNYHDKKIVYHSGGVDGMRTMMTVVPEERLGILVFTNMESPGIASITNQILDMCLDFSPKPWLDWYCQYVQETHQKLEDIRKKKLDCRIPDTRAHLNLENYCGVYCDRKVGNVNITLENGSLFLRFEQNSAFQARLSHWHYETFEINWLDEYIPSGLLTFQHDSLGKPEKIKLDQPRLLDVDFSELEIIKTTV
jgi:CubicO group peptidase (beta-lactamase class C family)